MDYCFNSFLKRKQSLGKYKFSKINSPNLFTFCFPLVNSTAICLNLFQFTRKHFLAIRWLHFFSSQWCDAGNDFVKNTLRWKVFGFVPLVLWFHWVILFKKTDKKKSKAKQKNLPGTEILCMCCYLQCMPRHSWAPEPTWRAN